MREAAMAVPSINQKYLRMLPKSPSSFCCPNSLEIATKSRTNLVANARLYFNCLGKGHIGKARRSTSTGRHHSLLHLEGELCLIQTHMILPAEVVSAANVVFHLLT